MTDEEQSVAALATPVGFAEIVLGLDLYDWQGDVLTRLEAATGPAAVPTRISVPAPNGSGKSSGIVAAAALWWAGVHKKGRVIITSKDARQLDNQVWPAMERMKERLDGWDWKQRHITTPTGGEIIGFTTNHPGRAEGWHKTDDVDGPLLIIVDEAKSVEENIFTAFDRCTYNALLLVSSPGRKSGRFFESVTKYAALYYVRRVGLKDCPHIPQDKIDAIVTMYGREHPFAKSALDGEFMSDEDMAEFIVDVDAWDRCLRNPPPRVTGKRVAFCDFGKGKAENVIAVREGNALIALECWREADEMAAVGQFIMRFRRLKLEASAIWGDEGGDIGATMLKLLREAGWNINAMNFGRPAYDKTVYVSWGSEAWHEFGRKVIGCAVRIELEREDDILRAQLTSRKHYVQREGKLALEDKHDMAKRGLASPDRADAAVGVFNVWQESGTVTQPGEILNQLHEFDHDHEPALGGYDAGM